MISPIHESDRGLDRSRWRAARRTLRNLPVLDGEPRSVQAILASTVERSKTTLTAPSPHRFAGPDRLPRRADSRRGLLAAAACLGLAWLGGWLIAGPAGEPGVSEVELAPLDADVELALVRLGRVLRETERITAVDVLGVDSPQITMD